MSSIDESVTKETLHRRLLDAVKACQVHLSSNKQLATESNSW